MACKAFMNYETLEDLEKAINKFGESSYIIATQIFPKMFRDDSAEGSMYYRYDAMVYSNGIIKQPQAPGQQLAANGNNKAIPEEKAVTNELQEYGAIWPSKYAGNLSIAIKETKGFRTIREKDLVKQGELLIMKGQGEELVLIPVDAKKREEHPKLPI